jgi:hypothetical protein
MHAVVVKVTVNDVETAEKNLQEHVLPRIKQMPGFMTGYWTRSEGQGFQWSSSSRKRTRDKQPTRCRRTCPQAMRSRLRALRCARLSLRLNERRDASPKGPRLNA